MPNWENNSQIRLDDAILEVDDPTLLDKSRDNLQVKKKYILKIATFITGKFWGLTGNAGTNPSTNFLGTTDNQDVVFKQNGIKKAILPKNTNVGILSALEVDINEYLASPIPNLYSGFATINNSHTIVNVSTIGASFGWEGIAIGGTITAPTLPITNALMSTINGTMYDGTTFVRVCRMRMHADGTPTALSLPTKITFLTTPIGTKVAVERIVIKNNGNVGIGAPNPTEILDIVGNLKFSGALMPNNIPGTAGQVLTSAGAGLAPTWGSNALTALTSKRLDAAGGYTVLPADYSLHLVSPYAGIITIPSAASSKDRIIQISNHTGATVNTSIAFRITTSAPITAIGNNTEISIMSDGVEWYAISN